MIFTYRSVKFAGERVIPPLILKELRQYLRDCGYGMTWTYGKLQNTLLDFTYSKNGDRLMINQLEPIFTYLCRAGQLWPEEEEMDSANDSSGKASSSKYGRVSSNNEEQVG